MPTARLSPGSNRSSARGCWVSGSDLHRASDPPCTPSTVSDHQFNFGERKKKGSPAFSILLFSGSRPAYAQPGAAGPAVRRRVHAIICSKEDADTSGHLQLLRVRWNQHLAALLVPALAGTALPACFFHPEELHLNIKRFFRGNTGRHHSR